jgi:N-acetylglutamate synthase
MTSPDIVIRTMVAADYPRAIDLWQRTEGIGLSESDTETAIGAFLARNPGLSALATARSGEVVGFVLCGHDGRRGYLHHLAVALPHRGRGVARALIDFCFARLAAAGIEKCNIFVYRENEDGVAFWRHNGWAEPTWKLFQKRIEA